MHCNAISESLKIQVMSVTELNSQARRLLEINFHNIRVDGEISGLARPSSGHWYFTLKDDRAQIRCVMFTNRNKSLQFTPSEGMQIQVRGRISIYENRGDYQLIIEHMNTTGRGGLHKAFEALKQKLTDEDLFDNEHKQKLPDFPQHIIVITSPTGAAIRDILSVFKRRSPFIKVSIIASAVQGENASHQLVQALQMSKRINADAVIIGRGGGSIEDLWPFNNEALARAIISHPIPVVSAVGHETDFTIADFVADYRAPTPSAASEILSPDCKSIIDKINQLNRKMTALAHRCIQLATEQINHISKRLRHPGYQLRENTQRLDDLEIRINQALRLVLERKKSNLQAKALILQQHDPQTKIIQYKLMLNHQNSLLKGLMLQYLKNKQNSLEFISAKLNAVSPLSTMSRGYSITQQNEKVITSAKQLHINDKITIMLHKGYTECTVNRSINKHPTK